MAGYDPKRTRPATTEVVADEPPQVDALLAPVSASPAPTTAKPPVVVPDPPPEPRPDPVTVSVSERPIPVDVPVAPAPDKRTARLAIVGGVAAATVAAVMLIRRVRRR